MAKEKSSSSKTDDVAGGSFEESFEELQKLVKNIESGSLTLDESIETFERGVKLAATCRKRLEEAEAKIQRLTEENKLEDFDRKTLDE